MVASNSRPYDPRMGENFLDRYQTISGRRLMNLVNRRDFEAICCCGAIYLKDCSDPSHHPDFRCYSKNAAATKITINSDF